MALFHTDTRGDGADFRFPGKEPFKLKPSRLGTSHDVVVAARQTNIEIFFPLSRSRSRFFFSWTLLLMLLLHTHTPTPTGPSSWFPGQSARTPPNHARPSRPNTAGDGRCSSYTPSSRRGALLSAHTHTHTHNRFLLCNSSRHTLICCREGGSIKKAHAHCDAHVNRENFYRSKLVEEL